MVRLTPELGTQPEVKEAMACSTAKSRLLQSWADLVREEALLNLEELAATKHELAEHELIQWWGHTWRKLQQVASGKANSLGLIRAMARSRATRENQAETLSNHWTGVLSERPPNPTRLLLDRLPIE